MQVAGQIEHFPDITIVRSGVKIKVSMERFEKQLKRAQYALDSQIMTDMVPYMPHVTGTFINTTRGMSATLAGSGQVIAAAPPMGRFLYMGVVMVDPATGSPYARLGAKKVVTGRELKYSNPKATAMWFETAKAKHGESWIKLAKKKAGGGNG